MRHCRIAFLVLSTLAVAACGSSDGGSGGAAGDVPEGGPVTTGGDGAAPPPAEDSGTTPGPRPKSSGGKGGLSCTSKVDAGGGHMLCTAKVGSVEIKVIEPLGMADQPLALGLYVHGDGAAAYKSASAMKAMLAWADAKHALAVGVLAPNGCAWWQAPNHDCAGTSTDVDTKGDNAVALDAALGAIEKAYDVRDDGRYYYGSSGGSIFLTDEWIPAQGGKRAGVFALMCGGDASTRAYAWDAKDATMRAKSPLFFTYGDKDFLKPDIEKSIADFEAKSFAVTSKVIPNAEHCAFDAHGEAVGIWMAH